MLVVHLFVHSRECDNIYQIGAKPVPNASNVCPTNTPAIVLMYSCTILAIYWISGDWIEIFCHHFNANSAIFIKFTLRTLNNSVLLFSSVGSVCYLTFPTDFHVFWIHPTISGLIYGCFGSVYIKNTTDKKGVPLEKLRTYFWIYAAVLTGGVR